MADGDDEILLALIQKALGVVSPPPWDGTAAVMTFRDPEREPAENTAATQERQSERG